MLCFIGPTKCSTICLNQGCELVYSAMLPTQFTHWLNPLLPQECQPVQSMVNCFWQGDNVMERLKNLQETVDLLQAMKKELEETLLIQTSRENVVETVATISDRTSETMNSSLPSEFDGEFFELLRMKKANVKNHESLLIDAFRSLFLNLKNQLRPFVAIESQLTPWEEKSVAARLAQKLQKHRRNKLWKKKKRKRIAELMRENHENFFRMDKDADEWRAREIAKDIAVLKVESMKSIAKIKASKERKKLEAELELVLVVEKLQELRSIRIQKLKKQGHFLPEEDDKFLEQVRAAVEEEEHQTALSQRSIAKDKTPFDDEFKDTIHTTDKEESEAVNESVIDRNPDRNHEKLESERSSANVGRSKPGFNGTEGRSWEYDSVGNLPFEFYHYYHGSSNDMGTLIEVRRQWDAWIRPGGSRIPGHWVQPPAPADEVWASYLVR